MNYCYLKDDGFYSKNNNCYYKFHLYEEDEHGNGKIFKTYNFKLGTWNISNMKLKLVPTYNNIIFS